jgi:ankyrin repeat protein
LPGFAFPDRPAVIDLVRLLLQRGADKTIRDDKFGSNPEGWAAEFGHHDIAALIAAS